MIYNEQKYKSLLYEVKETAVRPESIEYFEYRLEQATKRHEGIKSGAIPKEHAYSLTYAKKEVNEVLKALETAKKLWA